jgi:hypothetical protein
LEKGRLVISVVLVMNHPKFRLYLNGEWAWR